MDSANENSFSSEWIQSAVHFPYGLEITFYPFLLGPVLEALWATFVERRVMAIFKTIIRIVGGWILLNYYMYGLYVYYMKPDLI